MRKRRQDIIKQGTLGFTKAQSLKPKAGTHRVPFPCLLALFLLACGSSVPQMPTTPEQPKTPETPEEPEIPGMEGATSGGGRSGGGRGGCRTFPVSVFLNAHKDMNRNREGQAMPVEVKAYLLKGRQLFEELDFDTLRRDGDKALAEDLVTSLSFVVFPAKMKIQPIKAPADTAFVALVGLFRKHDGQLWKLVFDVRGLSGRCKKGQLHTPLKANLYRNSLRLDKDMPPEAQKGEGQE